MSQGRMTVNDEALIRIIDRAASRDRVFLTADEAASMAREIRHWRAIAERDHGKALTEEEREALKWLREDVQEFGLVAADQDDESPERTKRALATLDRLIARGGKP
jgi:hypothetical protein